MLWHALLRRIHATSGVALSPFCFYRQAANLFYATLRLESRSSRFVLRLGALI